MIEHVKSSEQVRESILELLNALNDPTRQQIIFLFQKQPEFCVSDIASRFSLSRPAISYHLNLMKRAKILVTRRDGKEIHYSFNKDYVLDTLAVLSNYFKGCC